VLSDVRVEKGFNHFGVGQFVRRFFKSQLFRHYMNSDPEWEKQGAKINAVTDRMAKAGWIKETLRNSEGMGIEYTPDGLEKMRQLWELLRAINFATMNVDDLLALYAVLMMFARNYGSSQ
jgi:hypothetical protein